MLFVGKNKKVEVVETLQRKLVDLQHSVDILTAKPDSSSTGYTGNPYKDYKSAISELSNKYENKADWGCQQTRNIVDIRSTFTIGQGIKVALKEEFEKTGLRELEFITQFMTLNRLDKEMPQMFAREAELEGRFLAHLVPDSTIRNVKLRYISFNTYAYEVKAKDDDYMIYDSVKYTPNGKATQEIKSEEFVYAKFAGRVDKVNELAPKLSVILRNIEYLDQALWGWRKMNKIHASPTPHFKCTTMEEVQDLYEKLRTTRWNVGKFVVSTSDFTIQTPQTGGMESLEKEIITNAKIISGASGVPVHFLGLPDLMSNRAVSTDMFEFINASVSTENIIWTGTYSELFDRVLLLSNDRFQTGFKTGLFDVSIPTVTTQKMQELVDVWLPLYSSNAIDLDTMLSKIPDINSKKVKANIKAEDDLQNQLNDLMNQQSQGGINA